MFTGRGFEIYKKISFLKKIVEQSQNKGVKKLHKKTGKFDKDNIPQLFIATLVLELNCYCGDDVKYRFLSKHSFHRMQQHGG